MQNQSAQPALNDSDQNYFDLWEIFAFGEREPLSIKINLAQMRWNTPVNGAIEAESSFSQPCTLNRILHKSITRWACYRPSHFQHPM
jgi:hypothetical protein